MEESSTPQNTFLHEDVEVEKTGRTATRKLRNNKVDERFEITPVDKMNGGWKKWVRESDLYTIG